jgi:Domain of unknown function (DUF3291)
MPILHLAQLNVARPRAAMDDEQMAEFAAALNPINSLADSAPGFVWRLTDEGSNDATATRVYGGEIMVNLSVWESRQALWNFVYKSPHFEYLQRRREWFHRMADAYHVLWWVPTGQLPTVKEATGRLDLLRAKGPTADAFTFRQFFEPKSLAAR